MTTIEATKEAGVLLVHITTPDFVMDNEQFIFLPYNQYTQDYARQLWATLLNHHRTLQDTLDGDHQIDTELYEGATTIKEARFAAQCLAQHTNEADWVSGNTTEYDAEAFTRLLEKVTTLIHEFHDTPEDSMLHSEYEEYVTEHLNTLTETILG